jgi:hypothetical protein
LSSRLCQVSDDTSGMNGALSDAVSLRPRPSLPRHRRPARQRCSLARARLAPVMISMPGHRVLRRRQRRAPPAWFPLEEPGRSRTSHSIIARWLAGWPPLTLSVRLTGQIFQKSGAELLYRPAGCRSGYRPAAGLNCDFTTRRSARTFRR